MGSFRSWTSDRFEAVDDEQLGDGSSSHLTDSDGAADENYNEPLEKSEQSSELRSPATFRVSVELNHMLEVHVPELGHVPNRIPSSVFSGKPATATDWSTVSNESSFSIHVANGSYSKEQFFMLHKSGELTKLDEKIIAQGNPLPPLKELEDRASVNENTVIDETAEDHSYSFVFPVLKGATDVDNGDKNNKELQAQPVKQQQHEKPTGELQPETPVTPQSCFSCCWFSWFNCCGCSCSR